MSVVESKAVINVVKDGGTGAGVTADLTGELLEPGAGGRESSQARRIDKLYGRVTETMPR